MRAAKQRMLMALMMLGLVALPGAALAQWRTLGDAEIEGVLSGRTVLYDRVGWQIFGATGRTVFRAEEAAMGQISVGEWRVIDNRYCQRWSRVADWACYTLDYDGADGVRFTDALGNPSAGRFAPP
ncbi:hypothetical protein roselon_03294 [Roseibacterium elongatum DSM 19469]|uniref:Uncharacterized protein n=1 Tax=Roseicyclus elongatus DSM 19469 TaxID=1294273 RepID=W8S5Q3_9RHOB|nr:hypothetical protein [Roseibacterium elongatum]AHM05552.1 hypothetical protein roselon_03294 [Roseibacterium elongatum DSM 19469]